MPYHFLTIMVCLQCTKEIRTRYILCGVTQSQHQNSRGIKVMTNPYASYILVTFFCMAFAVNNLFRLRKGYNIGKEKPILMKIIVVFLILAVTDIIWGLAEGQICVLPHWLLSINYGLSLIMTGMGCYYWALFVEARINIPVNHWLKVLFDIPMIFLGTMLVISMFTGWIFYADARGLYQVNDLFYIQEIIPCGYLVFSVLHSFIAIFQTKEKTRKKEYFSYILFILFDFVALWFEDDFPTIPLFELTILVSIQVLFFTVYLDTQYAYAQREKELADSRAAMMISQIQPHFIYNVLSVIRSLCKEKAPEAAEITTEFADYLRGNLDSLDIKEPIPFLNELKHTKTYLALEKKRFGDRINITYDIQADNFRIPALCLQPLVENAVKHGLLVREEGGSIQISSWQTETESIVTVADNGVGFDVNVKKAEDGRSHIGISNVRERLDYMCKGTLEIQSEVGFGTTSTIRIPRER